MCPGRSEETQAESTKEQNTARNSNEVEGGLGASWPEMGAVYTFLMARVTSYEESRVTTGARLYLCADDLPCLCTHPVHTHTHTHLISPLFICSKEKLCSLSVEVES